MKKEHELIERLLLLLERNTHHTEINLKLIDGIYNILFIIAIGIFLNLIFIITLSIK